VCSKGGDAAAAAKAALEPAAKLRHGQPGAPLFAVGECEGTGEGSIMRFCNLKMPEGGATLFAIIDVPKRAKALLGSSAPSAEDVEEWVAAYVAGTAKTVGIKE
jgi:hypothetical protein